MNVTEEEKKEAAGRISLFLKMLFGTIESLEVSFYITKNHEIVIKDNKTGLSSTLTPEEVQEKYYKWAKESNI